MKRVVLSVIGVVLLILGLVGIGAAGLAFTTLDARGGYSARIADAQTSTAAVYASSFGVDLGGIPESAVDVTVSATSRNGKPLFLGVAKPDQVQPFLAGVPYEAVVRIEGQTLVVQPVPGTKTAAQAPGTQNFWLQSASGDSPELKWAGSQPGQVLIIMNADGSAGIAADIFGGVRIGQATLWIAGAAIVGLVVLMVGVILLYRGLRRRSSTAHA